MRYATVKRQHHTIPPIYDVHSKVLILGSFPSVKSREAKFYYGHAQNRFWKVIAAATEQKEPKTENEKRELLLSSGIALWDVVGECDIVGSSDISITNVEPNDISLILDNADIRTVFTNGKTAARLYERYIFPKTKVGAVTLPSTSPANASCSLERLIEKWKIIKEI